MSVTKGLPNCGNTCYFNSFLQFLFNIEEIQKYFGNYKEIAISNDYNDNEKELILILNSLKKIYYIICRGNDALPTNYKKDIGDTIQYIIKKSIGSQEDSAEVLSTLFVKASQNNLTNSSLNDFSNLLNKLFNNEIITTLLYDKKKYNCNYNYPFKKLFILYYKLNNTELLSNNLINSIFKINKEKMYDTFCTDNDGEAIKDINGKNIMIDEIYKYEIYDAKSKYIIINFVSYYMKKIYNNTNTEIIGITKHMSNYKYIEIDKSFSVNSIKYKIKGIIIHNGSLDGGHYYYLNFKNDICTKYNDSTFDEIKLNTSNDKYIFNENDQPVIIIYESDDNIEPLKQINYNYYESIKKINNEFYNKPQEIEINSNVNQLKDLINNHFTKLKKLNNK